MRITLYIVPVVCLLCICTNQTAGQFTWEHTNGPEGAGSYVLTSNDDYVFYSDDHFLYRTSDGYSWEQLPTPVITWLDGFGTSLLASRQTYHPSGNVSSELMLSRDNGVTWKMCTLPAGLTSVNNFAISSHGLYLTRGEIHGLYRSIDEGQSWESLSPPFQYGYDLDVWEDRLYMYNSDNVWRTDSSGNNWVDITPPMAQSDYVSAVFGHGAHLVILTFNGMFSSHDHGQTWNSYLLSYTNTIGDLAYDGTSVFALRGSAGLYRSPDFGDTWISVPVPVRQFYSLEVVDDKLLSCSPILGVYRWDAVAEVLVPANTGLYSAWTNSLRFDGDVIWALAGSGLFKFHPITDTWEQVMEPATKSLRPILEVGTNGLIVVSGNLDTFLVSQDAGETWKARVFPYGYINGIDPPLKLLDGVIYLENQYGFSRRVWRSDDLGVTWTEIFPSRWRSSGFEYFNGRLLVAAGDTIYASADEGTSWEVLSHVPMGSIGGFLVTEDLLFAYTSTSGENLLYASIDGITWRYAHTGLPSRFKSSYDQVIPFCLQSLDKYFLVIPGAGTYVSLDSAHTWLPVQFGGPFPGVIADGMMYAPSRYGVLRATAKAYGSLFSGNVFSDENNNGIQEPGEPNLPGVRVGLTSAEVAHSFYFNTTDLQGQYTLGVIPSEHDTVRPLRFSDFIESINPPFYTTESPGPGRTFGIRLSPNVHDLSIHSHLGNVRPGFDVQYHIEYKNDGTSIQDAAVSAVIDDALDFISADPAPSSVLGDSMVWNVDQLSILQNGSISIMLHVPVSTPLGLIVENKCQIYSNQVDITPTNNIHVASRRVVGSYDPNDKAVFPPEGLTKDEIEDGMEVLYTIQFQNTGTYQADRVRITDQIDTALVYPSLRLVASSHQVTSFELMPGGLLVIKFDQINLPDSASNEPASHGFVTFAAKRKSVYDPDDLIVNRAGIFFDFNEPIITNEVVFALRSNDPTFTNQTDHPFSRLSVYPNPSTGEVNIRISEPQDDDLVLRIWDLQGRQHDQFAPIKCPDGSCHVTLNLPDGVYILQLTSPDFNGIGKVLVMKDLRE